ncbi:MAG: ABC transporter substrate-binding protein [Candidatus Giovannonibacteria bacterium]|nr:MAG: ABC transporter substrate-binding protein [Candidatus Giovannonibacteria bacterium]
MGNKKFFWVVVLILLIVAAFVFFVSPPLLRNGRQAPKRVAMLTASDLQLAAVDGIKAGFKELNLVEGRDFIIELKNPKGDRNLTTKMAREIVNSEPDLIVSVSTSASSAIKEANKDAKIPVVAVDVGNFKELGIENVQHPGGFMTGVIVDNVAIAPKRMEILKTLNPALKTIGVLVNPKHVSYDEIIKAHEDGAKKLGIKVLWYEMTKKEEVAPAMARLVKDRPDAVMTTSEATISGNSDLIAPSLRKTKIASIDFNVERGVGSGYLMVYGASRYDVGRQGARMISKVLGGEKPGDIPVEFASTLTFEINAALAGEMGIKIPESLLLQASKVYNE